MTFVDANGNELTYEEKARQFARYSDPSYPFLALAEESGEVMGKLAKALRKNSGYTVRTLIEACNFPDEFKGEQAKQLREDLIKELGDVQWQLAACCKELGVSLEYIQAVNIAKLEGREIRGTLVGEGDER